MTVTAHSKAKIVSSFKGLPHPHRRLHREQIGWTETVGEGSPRLDVLFPAEFISQSAFGLTLKDTAAWPRAVRDAYTKLSAGHVSVDPTETSDPLRAPEPGVVDEHRRGEIVRAAYWYRRLRDDRRRVADSATCGWKLADRLPARLASAVLAARAADPEAGKYAVAEPVRGFMSVSGPAQ